MRDTTDHSQCFGLGALSHHVRKWFVRYERIDKLTVEGERRLAKGLKPDGVSRFGLFKCYHAWRFHAEPGGELCAGHAEGVADRAHPAFGWNGELVDRTQ